MSGLPYTNAALKWLQHGATERRELLTKRGGSHPGSADEAADNPEQERCPAACSQGHHHPLPPGQQYSKSSLRSCSPLLRGVLESSWSVLRCKRKPSSSCFVSSPLTPSRFQFWAGSSRGGAALLSPLCGSGLLLCEPVKCQGKKFKPRRNRRGEREEETDTYPALFSEIKKKKSPKDAWGKSGEHWACRREPESYVSNGAAVATAGESFGGHCAVRLRGVSSRLSVSRLRSRMCGAEHSPGCSLGLSAARHWEASLAVEAQQQRQQ